MPLRVQRAMILAAGLGTRLRPLTWDTPKPLVPLWNRANLDHCIELLASWGVTDILVNLHAAPERIAEHLRTSTYSARITCSFEPELLGTGGGLRRAEWFFGEDPFWVLNADVAADLNPQALLRALARPKTLAALWLVPEHGPRTVEYRAGRIRNFRSEHPGSGHTATFGGLHLIRPAFFRHLHASKAFSVVPAYEAAIRAGWSIGGVVVPGSFWADLGTLEDYRSVHTRIECAAKQRGPGARLYDRSNAARVRALRREGVHCAGTCVVPVDATVAKGASLRDTVLWSGATVASGLRLAETVVARDVHLRTNPDGASIRLSDLPDAALRAALSDLGVSLGDATFMPLPMRGSDRTYARICAGRRSVLSVRYGVEREENAHFVALTRFLERQGVPVPKVLHHDSAQRLTLLEDLGRVTLGAAIDTPRSPWRGAYEKAIDALLVLHTSATRSARRSTRLPLQPPLDAALMRWEHDLFVDFVAQPVLSIDDAVLRRLRRDLRGVVSALTEARPVLVHRDLQSENIMLQGRRVRLIDYQGMRFGPAAYDLASLLYDPYVNLSEAFRRSLLARYNAAAVVPVDRRQLLAACVQRLLQASGAFGRFAQHAGTSRYARYLDPARERLHAAAVELGGLDTLVALTDEPWRIAGE